VSTSPKSDPLTFISGATIDMPLRWLQRHCDDLTEQLVRLAASCDAVYDGWGTQV
jgi:regulator of RNase E activity RraB